jgi:ribosome-associated protein
MNQTVVPPPSGTLPPELSAVLAAAGERKAEHLVTVDVRGKSSITDFFVIMSGRSSRQVSALAEHIRDSLKEAGFRPLGIEGLNEGQWVLLDFVNVIVHIFHDPVRSFYDLEGLWSDAPRIPASTPKAETPETLMSGTAD